MYGILGSSVGSVDGSSTYIGYLVGTIDCDINFVSPTFVQFSDIFVIILTFDRRSY